MSILCQRTSIQFAGSTWRATGPTVCYGVLERVARWLLVVSSATSDRPRPGPRDLSAFPADTAAERLQRRRQLRPGSSLWRLPAAAAPLHILPPVLTRSTEQYCLAYTYEWSLITSWMTYWVNISELVDDLWINMLLNTIHICSCCMHNSGNQKYFKVL